MTLRPAPRRLQCRNLGGCRFLRRDDLGRLPPGAKADILRIDLDRLGALVDADPIKALIDASATPTSTPGSWTATCSCRTAGSRGWTRRRSAQTAVALLSLILVAMALRGGSGAEWSCADLLSPAGIVSAVGTFVLGSTKAMQWPVIVGLAVGALAYVADWLATRRMHTVYSEFWYAVRGRSAGAG